MAHAHVVVASISSTVPYLSAVGGRVRPEVQTMHIVEQFQLVLARSRYPPGSSRHLPMSHSIATVLAVTNFRGKIVRTTLVSPCLHPRYRINSKEMIPDQLYATKPI